MHSTRPDLYSAPLVLRMREIGFIFFFSVFWILVPANNKIFTWIFCLEPRNSPAYSDYMEKTVVCIIGDIYVGTGENKSVVLPMTSFAFRPIDLFW